MILVFYVIFAVLKANFTLVSIQMRVILEAVSENGCKMYPNSSLWKSDSCNNV